MDCPKCLRTQIVDLGVCSCGFIYRDAPVTPECARTSSTSESLDEIQDQDIVRGEVNGLQEVTYGFIVAGMVSIFGVGAIMLLVGAGAGVKDWWDRPLDRIETQQPTYRSEPVRSQPRQPTGEPYRSEPVRLQSEPVELAPTSTNAMLACDTLRLSVLLDRTLGLSDVAIRQELVLGLREGGMTGSNTAILSQIRNICGTAWGLD